MSGGLHWRKFSAFKLLSKLERRDMPSTENSQFPCVTTLPPARTQLSSPWCSSCEYTEQGCVREPKKPNIQQLRHKFSILTPDFSPTSTAWTEAKLLWLLQLRGVCSAVPVQANKGSAPCSSARCPERCRSCFCSASLGARLPPSHSVMTKSAPSTTLQWQALPPSTPKSKGKSLTVPGLLQLQLGIGSGLRGAVVLPLLGLGQTADKIHTGGENCVYWWIGAILNTPSDTPRFKE